jgi:hypothetical protein
MPGYRESSWKWHSFLEERINFFLVFGQKIPYRPEYYQMYHYRLVFFLFLQGEDFIGELHKTSIIF